MRLTRHTDCSLRMPIFLACEPGRPATIAALMHRRATRSRMPFIDHARPEAAAKRVST